MTNSVTRHDAWNAGDSYDSYMGRWSRAIAPRFLDWLGAPDDQNWLDVGCGTGALSASILAQCQPRSLIAVDSSAGFLERARAATPHERAFFQVGDAQDLPLETASRDITVSALVLNFVHDKETMLAEMKRVTRPGGSVGLYVWDYPGGGVAFMRAFWAAAASLDAAAGDLAENKRFPYCTPDGLTALATNAGLASIACAPLEIATVFEDFDDLWRPFTLGAGPAPGYCATLSTDARERLKQALYDMLPHRDDGSIHLAARAWAIKARVA
ncbi:class I SAM-dependent methyltransferase [Reyranella sp. CPCC 100927]|nr:class I SAM-dependent methyltransferase [Reyranella sp. CPCC 100927]